MNTPSVLEVSKPQLLLKSCSGRDCGIEGIMHEAAAANPGQSYESGAGNETENVGVVGENGHIC